MTDREIGVPFRLDGQGRVATVSDPLYVGVQHLETYLLTQPGERAMRPNFGSGVRNFIFENIDLLQMQLLATTTGDKVSQDVPGVSMKSLTATEGSEPGEVDLTVEFALAVGAGEGDIRTSQMTLGGSS